MVKEGRDLGFPKLKGSSNWQQWEGGMQYHLLSEKLCEYVEEERPCPDPIVLSLKDQDDHVKMTCHEKITRKIRTWHAQRQNCVGTMLSWVGEDIAIDVEAKKVLQTNIDPEATEGIAHDYADKWTPKKL